MADQNTDTATHADSKEKVQKFLKPFKPLGQAIVVFAKTTAGKTVGGVIVFIFIITSVTTLIHDDKRDDKNDFFFDDYYNDRSSNENDPRARHDRQMRMFDAEMRATQERMAKHRDELQRLFSLNKEDINTKIEQDPKSVHQTISKVNIVNDEQFGYTLNISGGILNGKLNGDNLSGVIAKLGSADITLSGNTFSIPYSLETLEKVVNILDNK